MSSLGRSEKVARLDGPDTWAQAAIGWVEALDNKQIVLAVTTTAGHWGPRSDTEVFGRFGWRYIGSWPCPHLSAHIIAITGSLHVYTYPW